MKTIYNRKTKTGLQSLFNLAKLKKTQILSLHDIVYSKKGVLRLWELSHRGGEPSDFYHNLLATISTFKNLLRCFCLLSEMTEYLRVGGKYYFN